MVWRKSKGSKKEMSEHVFGECEVEVKKEIPACCEAGHTHTHRVHSYANAQLSRSRSSRDSVN